MPHYLVFDNDNSLIVLLTWDCNALPSERNQNLWVHTIQQGTKID